MDHSPAVLHENKHLLQSPCSLFFFFCLFLALVLEDIPSCCPLYKGSSGLCPANISDSEAVIKLELCVSIFMFIHYLHIIPDISISEMAADFFSGSFPNCKNKHADFSGVHWRAEQRKTLCSFQENL